MIAHEFEDGAPKAAYDRSILNRDDPFELFKDLVEHIFIERFHEGKMVVSRL